MAVFNTLVRMRNRYRRILSEHFGRRTVQLNPPFPIISFTFDDFPRSSLQQGGAILVRHGVRGTYYTSLGLMDQQIPAGRGFSIEDLRQTVADGHELGCHTFTHYHAWKTKPGVFEDSIVENQSALARLVPGADFASLSYPIDYPRPQTKRRTARHFVCARGGGQMFNLGTADANNLHAFFLEKSRDNPEAIRRLIDENRRSQGWLIFATHDVCETPSPYGCAPDFFEDIVCTAVKSGARVVPVGKAWDLINGGKP